jgi:hypothetical protein
MKVNQAKICLTCDEIYDHNEQFCPSCTEKESIYLPAYFPILTPLRIIKEVKKDGTFSHYTLQMVSKEKSVDSVDTINLSHSCAKPVEKLLYDAQSSLPSRFAPDYNPEPPESKTGKSDHSGGESMERESSFIKGCHRLDANISKIWDAFCGIFRDGVILSRKEYHSWNQNPEILPADFSKLAGGIK